MRLGLCTTPNHSTEYRCENTEVLGGQRDDATLISSRRTISIMLLLACCRTSNLQQSPPAARAVPTRVDKSMARRHVAAATVVQLLPTLAQYPRAVVAMRVRQLFLVQIPTLAFLSVARTDVIDTVRRGGVALVAEARV